MDTGVRSAILTHSLFDKEFPVSVSRALFDYRVVRKVNVVLVDGLSTETLLAARCVCDVNGLCFLSEYQNGYLLSVSLISAITAVSMPRQ